MDVEHPGQLRVVGRRTEAIDLEQQPFTPGPAVVAHDGDRLVRRGEVVGTTEPLRETAAGLGLHHRGVWRAGLAQPVRTGGQHADPLSVVGPPCEGRLGGVEVLAGRSRRRREEHRLRRLAFEPRPIGVAVVGDERRTQRAQSAGPVTGHHPQVSDPLPTLGGVAPRALGPGVDLLVELDGLDAGINPDLGRQRLAQRLVDGQRLGPLARRREDSHQPVRRFLVHRIHRHGPAKQTCGLDELTTRLEEGGQLDEHGERVGLQFGVPTDHPLFVPIFGKELTPAQRRWPADTPRCLSLARASDGGQFERVDVDPRAGRQAQQLALRDDQGRAVAELTRQLGTRSMHHLAEVAGGRDRVQLGPQRVDDLVAMEPVTRRQGQHLHKGLRLAPTPVDLVDNPLADADSEAPQQLDRHRRLLLTDGGHETCAHEKKVAVCAGRTTSSGTFRRSGSPTT